MIISTNKSIEQLKDMYHERTIDRLLEICTPMENKGKSIRKGQAKKNTDLLREILR
jgi:DNA replication protein DnaC